MSDIVIQLDPPHVHFFRRYRLYDRGNVYYVGYECIFCGEAGYAV